MKKVLSFLGTLALTISTTISVIACGKQVENDVLFILPGNVVSQTSRVNKAYRTIVNEFNQSSEMKGSKVKVKVSWEMEDPIQDRINSGQQLPDLYLSYADNASRYALDPKVGTTTRNMEQSATGLEEKTSDFQNQFWSQNFYNEGLVNNELHVLPMNKSFDAGLLNLKVFLELVSFVNPSWATEIGDGLKAEGLTNQQTSLFVPLKDKQVLDLGNLEESLKPIVAAENKNLAIREFFRLNANVLDLASLYSQLYQNNLNEQSLRTNYLGPNGDLKKVYSLGIESIANRIFIEYADAMKKSNINPTTSDANDFIYDIKNLDPAKGSLDLNLENVDSKNFQGLKNFFDKIWAFGPKDKTVTTVNQRWSGSMILGKLDPKIVSGVYFVQGTMLLNSITTASTWDYNPIVPEGVKEKQFNRDTDLIIVPNATTTNNYANFLQQGAGIAGFKSVGGNASTKEKVVTKFLQYLLKPQNQSRLAIMSGHLPSTKKALEMYKYYKDGSFDNVTGKWNDNVELPANSDDFKQVVSWDFDRKPLDEKDLLITDFLKNYATKPETINVVTTTGNPLGTVIRNAIVDSLTNYIFKEPAKYSFKDLLENGTGPWSLKNQIQNRLPGSYTNARINFRNKK